MASEASKGKEVEIPIFLEFIRSGNLSFDPSSVQKRNPPEPDILCRATNGEDVAFELVEICDHNLARNREHGAYIRTSDPSFDIVKNKLSKRYVTEAPIELLCYINGRVVSPDSFIAERVAVLFSETVFQYRRVWLFGRREVRLLWEQN
jgi:hypothetical protein